MPASKLLVGVVGPCGSGKSTLLAALEERGYKCRHIAQEHSYVKDMWKRISNPDVLVFLQASFPVCTARRQLNWNESDYAEQQRRLAHALERADLVVDTDNLTPQEVATRVLDFLEKI
jgi:RNase adaptor protein for sRNA GlmZ degradation